MKVPERVPKGALGFGQEQQQIAIWDTAPQQRGIAVWDKAAKRLVQLSADHAQRVLEEDDALGFQVRKWHGVTGQARKPPEEQEGRLIVIDPERCKRILDGLGGLGQPDVLGTA